MLKEGKKQSLFIDLTFASYQHSSTEANSSSSSIAIFCQDISRSYTSFTDLYSFGALIASRFHSKFEFQTFAVERIDNLRILCCSNKSDFKGAKVSDRQVAYKVCLLFRLPQKTKENKVPELPGTNRIYLRFSIAFCRERVHLLCTQRTQSPSNRAR